jgi:hypothetical protein
LFQGKPTGVRKDIFHRHIMYSKTLYYSMVDCLSDQSGLLTVLFSVADNNHKRGFVWSCLGISVQKCKYQRLCCGYCGCIDSMVLVVYKSEKHFHLCAASSIPFVLTLKAANSWTHCDQRKCDHKCVCWPTKQLQPEESSLFWYVFSLYNKHKYLFHIWSIHAVSTGCPTVLAEPRSIMEGC